MSGGEEAREAGPGLADDIKRLALALGFDRVGIASPAPGEDMQGFADWLAKGYAGEMDYLGRRAEERLDPSRVLPGIRSVVVVALVYDPVAGGRDAGATGAPGAAPGPARGRVAGYAGGEDYHDVLLDRLRALEAGMGVLAGRDVEARSYVDTGPVLERVFAARAGIGWIGKNSLVLDREVGSRMLLGVVLSDLVLAFDAPVTEHCGTCRACLDVCPTEAFEGPYVLDATRCLAYTTIELAGSIPEPLRAGQGDQLFGCDLCQDVCPWNRDWAASRRADPLGLRERLRPASVWRRGELGWVLGLDEASWQRASRHTALRRTGRRALIRNALVAAGNAGDPDLVPAIRRHAEGADPLLAEHAAWALARMKAPPVSRG